MTNPWLHIPLSDYEGHMGLPQVGQAEMLANHFGVLLKRYSPDSVAILGCAGGNGFDRVDPAVTNRLVGIDINPTYIASARERFQCLPELHLLAANIETDDLTFEPVAFLYAALVFEYVNVEAALARLPRLMKPDGLLCTVVQLPNASVPDITPSSFSSLARLSDKMRLVAPQELCALARKNGLREVDAQVLTLPSIKQFQSQLFQHA